MNERLGECIAHAVNISVCVHVVCVKVGMCHSKFSNIGTGCVFKGSAFVEYVM